MIWVDGRIVADDDLKISVLDRTFEHGLGLFETFRTWNGRAPLLDRHLARLERSARELGIPLDSVSLPDRFAVEKLVEREGIGENVALRITLTGGRDAVHGSTLFMKARPLPAEMRHDGAVVDIGNWIVSGEDDALARHKSLNYWARRRAHESAKALGFDETVSSFQLASIGLAALEGSRTNVFFLIGETLTTPSLSLPIVPGIMRELVIELADELGLSIVEKAPFVVENLDRVKEVFLTNSVRGIIPVQKLVRTEPFKLHQWPAPGPLTRLLMILASDWLQRQGNVS